MTKEELKQEAEEYADKYGKSNFDIWDTARFAYYQSAEPREKQIAELGERCLQLQKDKGNLTDRVRELEAQIEKMKCCGNCTDCAAENKNCWTLKRGEQILFKEH